MTKDTIYPLHKLIVTRKPRPNLKKTLVYFCLLAIVTIIGLSTIKVLPRVIKYFSTGSGNIQYLPTEKQVSALDSVWVMLGQVNQARILTDLRRLTGAEAICLDNTCTTISNRRTGTDGLKWAEDYIIAQLIDLGYTVQALPWTRNNYSDRNLVVRIPGEVSPAEEIYFVAHMDGENCPAADDNASGAVSLLELARVLQNRHFEKTIVLLFSSGEEQSTLGVSSYIDSLTPQQLAAIKYVVNVDMVGYDANKDGVMELFNGSQPLDFVELLSGIISTYHLNLDPQIYSDCG